MICESLYTQGVGANRPDPGISQVCALVRVLLALIYFFSKYINTNLRNGIKFGSCSYISERKDTSIILLAALDMYYIKDSVLFSGPAMIHG